MISDPWIDRSWRPGKKSPRQNRRGTRTDRAFKTDSSQRTKLNQRRDQLRAMKKCINGPLVGNVGLGGVVHGPVFKIDRCLHCYLVKAKHDDAATSLRPRRHTKFSSARP